jgi:hypothetical protein
VVRRPGRVGWEASKVAADFGLPPDVILPGVRWYLRFGLVVLGSSLVDPVGEGKASAAWGWWWTAHTNAAGTLSRQVAILVTGVITWAREVLLLTHC